MTDQYSRDQQIETMTAEFLDTYFYSKFKTADIQRYSDTYHQFGGVDLAINNTHFDEKVKVYGCLNEVQQYVAFECSIKNKGGYISDGWFQNDSLSTDYYSIIGLSANVSKVTELTSSSQISAVDILWVKKQDVIDFINDNNLSKEQLKQDAVEIRDRGNNNKTDIFGNTALDKSGKYRTRYNHKNFWLTYSTKMKEQPVNLVIPREHLLKLPHSRHFVVHTNKVNIDNNSK